MVGCDLPTQLPQLELNAQESCLPVKIVPYFWGESTACLTAAVEAAVALAAPTHPCHRPRALARPYDLVLASDIVFIAIRDGLTGQLASTLVELAGCTYCAKPPIHFLVRVHQSFLVHPFSFCSKGAPCHACV